MAQFTLEEALQMQRQLQEKYRDIWEPIGPETAKNKLLWMLGEAGEVIDILKKNGGTEAVQNESLRAQLTEELADVLMYFGDVLLCCNISAEELGEAYRSKHARNLTRW